MGWHIPTDFEWTTLSNCLGGDAVAGGPMKETGTTHWTSPNTGATNASGFTGLPGGTRDGNGGGFGLIGDNGSWWSSTEGSTTNAWFRDLGYGYAGIGRNSFGKRSGFSVRCIRD